MDCVQQRRTAVNIVDDRRRRQTMMTQGIDVFVNGGQWIVVDATINGGMLAMVPRRIMEAIADGDDSI